MTLQINRRQWIQSLGACLLTVSGKRLQAQTSEGYTIPILDIDGWADHQVIVDREPGQYLGHPTTVLLEDGKTILTVYPKGHGKGPIQYKKSTDAGKSWSERLPTPPNWVTSGETPTHDFFKQSDLLMRWAAAKSDRPKAQSPWTRSNSPSAY